MSITQEQKNKIISSLEEMYNENWLKPITEICELYARVRSEYLPSVKRIREFNLDSYDDDYKTNIDCAYLNQSPDFENARYNIGFATGNDTIKAYVSYVGSGYALSTDTRFGGITSAVIGKAHGFIADFVSANIPLGYENILRVKKFLEEDHSVIFKYFADAAAFYREGMDYRLNECDRIENDGTDKLLAAFGLADESLAQRKHTRYIIDVKKVEV